LVTGRPRWSERPYGERGVPAEKVAASNQSLPPEPSWPSDVVVVAVVAPPSVEPMLSGLEDVVVVTEAAPPSDPESRPDVPPPLPLEELL
jgi:hypothetical protein